MEHLGPHLAAEAFRSQVTELTKTQREAFYEKLFALKQTIERVRYEKKDNAT
jgi:hypothetical protein